MDPMESAEENGAESPITEFYRGKNIFITGATGFVAKCVIEKFLRLTDANKIYFLVREKKGKNAMARTEEIKANAVFDRLKREKGEFVLNKLVPISGDLESINLGLSETDEKILAENVNLVIHAAAMLDFETNSKTVININLMGTKKVLDLCSRLNRLEALVYVSTAYVNSDKFLALEKLYPKPGNAEEFIALLKLTDEKADQVIKKLMNGHINSYTVSKALAEHEVDSWSWKIPTAVVRPSMIVGAWREPAKGWTDSKNGPGGFFMGAGMGVIRRLPVDENLVYDYIPVDIVANALIAAGWKVATERPNRMRIYHCTSSTKKPFCWNILRPKINTILTDYPLEKAVWYPKIKLHKSFAVFRISTLIFHFLPGFIFDSILRLGGRKAMLVKIHARIDSSLRHLEPFIFKEWFFDSSNTDELHASLTEGDRIKFNLDITKINYEEFFENAVIGVRRYLNKESDETLEPARKKARIFFFINFIVKNSFPVFVSWMMAAIFRLDLTSSIWISFALYIVFNLL